MRTVKYHMIVQKNPAKYEHRNIVQLILKGLFFLQHKLRKSPKGKSLWEGMSYFKKTYLSGDDPVGSALTRSGIGGPR